MFTVDAFTTTGLWLGTDEFKSKREAIEFAKKQATDWQDVYQVIVRDRLGETVFLINQ